MVNLNAKNDIDGGAGVPEASGAARLKFVLALAALVGAGSAALPRDANAETKITGGFTAATTVLDQQIARDKAELAELQRREGDLRNVPISGFDAGPTAADKTRARNIFREQFCPTHPDHPSCKQ